MSTQKIARPALLLLGSMLSSGSILAASGDFDPLPAGIIAPEDISGIAKHGRFLLLGADEARDDGLNAVQVLVRDGNGRLELVPELQIDLFTGEEDDEGGTELDIEGIAVDGKSVVVLGSHSAKRPRLKEEKTYAKNLKRLKVKAIKAEPNRARIYRLKIDAAGNTKAKKHISLGKLLKKHPVLKAYVPLPSKENGIDIEGIALHDGLLYLGFRGPVFRDGYVPVMVIDFEDTDDHELRFVRLGGRGIRDVTRVSDGFLIIAGPVGDGSASYPLYHWDGNDMVPGKKRHGRAIGTVKLLTEIEPPKKGKAEGLTVISEKSDSYDLLIAYDGVKNSGKVLQNWSVDK